MSDPGTYLISNRRATLIYLGVAHRGKLVLRLPADPVLLRYVLAGDAHGHQARCSVGHVGDFGIHSALPRHGVPRHSFHASGDTNVIIPRLYARRHVCHRLQATGALPVDRVHGDGFRETCEETRDARFVGPLG